ncbi:MAG: glycosyltransferase family 4 protein [Verrucomicrobiota bacterium]
MSAEKRSFKILTYPWHAANDDALTRVGHRFHYLCSAPREWNTEIRPLPKAILWVPDSRSVQTDLMILHLDQWSLQEPSVRFHFLHWKEIYPGKKIVINHGCNLVDGCSSEQMARLVEGCFMVCASETAQRLWNIPRSRVIMNGVSAADWPQTSYTRHEVLVVQPFASRHERYRNTALVEKAERKVDITWIGRDKKFESFQKYRHYVRGSSIFFNPSLGSPNPRARTEAMLSGLAVVTTNSHGEDQFITNGVNGFCSDNPKELVDYLAFLKANPAKTKEIGRAGRITAQKHFDVQRFSDQWNQLLNEVVSGTL